MYEITTHKELLLFNRFVSQHPAVVTSLLNAMMEHVKWGRGTIVRVVPDPDGLNGTKIHVFFDGSGLSREGIVTDPKVLVLPVMLENGLLKSLAVPSDTAEAFRSFADRAAQGTSAGATPADVPPLPPRKKDWGTFAALVKRHHIGSLYHFTDARNLDSIRRHGGLYSRWQCRQRRIRITAPGGDATSQRMDEAHGLQDYVRLAFNPCLPMMYTARREGRIKDVAILSIDPSVIYLEPTLFSDVNANDREARVGSDIGAFRRIDFGLATGDCWNGWGEKKRFQAEVLVKGRVALNLIRNL